MRVSGGLCGDLNIFHVWPDQISEILHLQELRVACCVLRIYYCTVTAAHLYAGSLNKIMEARQNRYSCSSQNRRPGSIRRDSLCQKTIWSTQVGEEWTGLWGLKTALPWPQTWN